MDANVLVSGIFWSGPPNQILRRWLEGRGILLITAPILAEYREVIERLAEDSELGARWNVLLTEFGEIVPPAKFEAQLCRDKDDEKYLEAAVGGRARAVISGDKDLLILRQISGIPILTPKAFLSFKSEV